MMSETQYNSNSDVLWDDVIWEHTPEPPAHKFKVGDYVLVTFPFIYDEETTMPVTNTPPRLMEPFRGLVVAVHSPYDYNVLQEKTGLTYSVGAEELSELDDEEYKS